MSFSEPPVMSDGQQMSQDGQLAVPDGQLAVPDGQLAVPDGQLAVLWPEHLTIGTKNAFKNNKAFPYVRKKIGPETFYVCNKGSDWARTNEVLVLRCENGTWTAFDGCRQAVDTALLTQDLDALTLLCRQAVFRCRAEDITKPGRHEWQTNYAADLNYFDEIGEADWRGALWAETRVP